MVNWGVRRMDGKATIGECKGFQRNQDGQCWGVLRAECKWTERARGHNTSGLAKFRILTQYSWDRKGSVNLKTGRPGRLQVVLRALNQGNVNIGVL